MTTWDDACAAARVFAVAPLGVSLHGRPGPWRDWWLARVRELLPANAPWRRVPPQVDAGRLLGGLDLAATLHGGRPVHEQGVLSTAHEGVLVLGMAERLGVLGAGIIAHALDRGEVVVERDGFTLRTAARFAFIALDESLDDEDGLLPGLADRVAMMLALPDGRLPQAPLDPTGPAAIVAARRRFAQVTVDEAALSTLSEVACALGLASLRPACAALNVARAAAALDGAAQVEQAHLALAIRLVMLPRAAFGAAAEPTAADGESGEQAGQDAPAAEPDAQPPQPSTAEAAAQRPGDAADDPSPEPQQAVVIDASTATLPPELLARIAAAAARARTAAPAGRHGPGGQSLRRGRPLGSTPGEPRQGARLDLVATLRAAAPWQRLRAGQGGDGRVAIRRSDFRVRRFKQAQETTTVFVVDASGSAAANRLGEAKGAVELMLAECYVRRDRVALIAFRGSAAEVLLEPTRSLVRAKRLLGRMPAGGGTPLAAGIDTAVALAGKLRRGGSTPQLIFLTDGRANVGRDGRGGSEAAMRDALDAASQVHGAGFGSAVIDVAPRPRQFAADCAARMAARYVALPHADAGAIAAAARTVAA